MSDQVTAPIVPTATAKQFPVAMSFEAKNAIVALCAEFPQQPGKTAGKLFDLTAREACDAVLEFVQAHRIGPDGTDLLALEVKRTLALRGSVERKTAVSVQLEELKNVMAEKDAKLAELMARLEAAGQSV